MMARDERWEDVRLPASTLKPVLRGHPWVYQDAVVRSSPGALVRLVSSEGSVVGFGLADEGDIAVRVLGRGAPPDSLKALVFERIRRADAFRLRVVDGETDAYRVVAGAGDGLPGLVIDRYADTAVVRVYGRCWEPHLGHVRDALRALGWPVRVVRKLGVARVDGGAGLEPLSGELPPDRVVVQEHGMLLWVEIEEGQKTGTFLDQREHRLLVRRWAPGRMVANLFSYTGGFSVAAALGGAAHVTTIDSAPAAIELARDNFLLNGLDPEDHAFEVADAFAWRPRSPVDLLILDPPSLARAGKSEGAARSAYRKLHRHYGGHVARDGVLVTASCTSRLPQAVWEAAVAEGLEGHGDWSWLWHSAEPPDHPTSLAHSEGRYLKLAALRRR